MDAGNSCLEHIVSFPFYTAGTIGKGNPTHFNLSEATKRQVRENDFSSAEQDQRTVFKFLNFMGKNSTI